MVEERCGGVLEVRGGKLRRVVTVVTSGHFSPKRIIERKIHKTMLGLLGRNFTAASGLLSLKDNSGVVVLRSVPFCPRNPWPCISAANRHKEHRTKAESNGPFRVILFRDDPGRSAV